MLGVGLFVLSKLKQSHDAGAGKAAPAPAGEKAPATPAPASGGKATSTGKSVYPVVGPIAATGDSRISGSTSSHRDNQGFPPAKCNREATWIWVPGTGGDWSIKMGSHGSGGDNGSLIEWTEEFGTGGKARWRCEGPHPSYGSCSGGTATPLKISGSQPIGIKGISWTAGGAKSHHEIWIDRSGTGNGPWTKGPVFEGSCSCNKMACPVPAGGGGAHAQDTLRVDKNSGHKFISRSMVEIKPGGAAAAKYVEMF
jgi:hypothetical protein